ncbi:MAG: efflux RND transporter periplasmic adaptor subunit [Methylocystis sp.]
MELARAKSKLDLARATAQRSRIDKATRAYERALARTKRCEALVARFEAALQAPQDDLQRTEVRAPMDGTVTFKSARTGQTVEGGKATLFVIEDRAVALIEVAPAPGDIDKVEIDDRASIKMDAAPGRSFEGVVTEIRKVENIVVLSAPDAEGVLEPGMTATARIVIDERIDVLRAPNEALRYSRNRNATRPAPVNIGRPTSSASYRDNNGSSDAETQASQETRESHLRAATPHDRCLRRRELPPYADELALT